MSWTTFGNLTAPTLPELDANFGYLFDCCAIPCGVSGTNTLTLTPPTNAPSLTAYQPGLLFTGIAAGTNTGAVTATVAALGALHVYLDTIAGPITLIGGEIKAGNAIVLAYDATLNGGAGGFHLVGGPRPIPLASLSTALTATGSTLAGALGLVSTVNVITTTASSTGVRLPDLLGSLTGTAVSIQVINEGSNTLSVYPSASTAQIDALGAGTAYSLNTKKVQVYTQTAGGTSAQWFSMQLG